MRHTTAIAAALMLCSGLAVHSAVGQQQSDAAMQDMMKKWQEMMTPGAQHKMLAGMEGTWDAETKMWMGPGDPEVTKGTASMKMVLGGRFLQQEISSTMMGRPFHGIGFTGYDNNDKKFVGFWIDDFGTSISTMEGSLNQKGDVLTMYGKMDEPTTGEHDKTVKYVTRTIDKDRVVLEIHDLSIGEPNTKVMETVYVRRK